MSSHINTQSGSDQTAFGTLINKTDLTNADVEVTQRFISSRKAMYDSFTIMCDLNGTFEVEQYMRASGRWVKITDPAAVPSPTGDADEPTISPAKVPLGISRVRFTVTGTTSASAVLEITGRSIPR